MNHDIINYFYTKSMEYGFVNLIYDPRCKTRKDVDDYMSDTNEYHKKISRSIRKG